MRPPLIVEQARRNSVAVQRLRVTKAQAEEIRSIETEQGTTLHFGASWITRGSP